MPETDPASLNAAAPHSPREPRGKSPHTGAARPSVLPNIEPSQAKDLPLTDIGTSPPPFELPELGTKRHGSKDSYESSELSDLGEDESEAETDKMDFLDDDGNPGPGETVSDLHRLSELTELARLQEVDSDDSDDVVDRLEQPAADEPPVHFLDAEASPKRAHNGEPPEKKRKLAQDAEDKDHESGTEPEVSLNGTSDVKSEGELENTIEDTLAPEESSDEEMHTAIGDIEAEADVEDTVKQEELEEQESERIADVIDTAAAPAIAAAVADLKEDTPEEEEEEDIDFDEHRKLAVLELVSIEEDFAHLRDKLFHDKLQLLEHELQLCLEGSHPELLQIYYKVNEFYQDNIKMANATLNYSLKCINNETIASRTAIHQDFVKNLMDMKNDMVTETTSRWYKINKERNYLDQVAPDYNFTALPSLAGEDKNLLLPITPGGSTMEYYQESVGTNKKVQKQNTLVELVRYRNGLNAQLGILNGLTEFHGIPCAVTNGLLEEDGFSAQELLLRKATTEEIDEDLQAMGILS